MRLFDENLHFISRELREDTAKSGIFCKQIVGVAPHPFLSGLRGNDHGMAGAVEVLCHVFVTGLVTTQGGATGLAGAEMHPGAADLDAFFAHMLFFLFELFYLPHMGANLICHRRCFYGRPKACLGYTSAKYL
jgi:hypothetical protein